MEGKTFAEKYKDYCKKIEELNVKISELTKIRRNLRKEWDMILKEHFKLPNDGQTEQ